MFPAKFEVYFNIVREDFSADVWGGFCWVEMTELPEVEYLFS